MAITEAWKILSSVCGHKKGLFYFQWLRRSLKKKISLDQQENTKNMTCFPAQRFLMEQDHKYSNLSKVTDRRNKGSDSLPFSFIFPLLHENRHSFHHRSLLVLCYQMMERQQILWLTCAPWGNTDCRWGYWARVSILQLSCLGLAFSVCLSDLGSFSEHSWTYSYPFVARSICRCLYNVSVSTNTL